MSPQVRVGGVGGVWLSTIAPVGGIEADVRWPLGAYQLNFNLLLGSRQRPTVVAQGALCDLLVGGLPVFPGRISEVDWSTGGVTVSGICRDAETTAALTAGGLTSTTIDAAIDAAISRGAWNVTRPASISSTAMAVSDETTDLNFLAALLDLWANDNNQRWYVDPFNAVRVGTDPTVPELYLLPGSGELPWATSQQATRIIGRWADANSGSKLTNTAVGSGSVERLVDLTSRGPIDSTTASDILNQILAQSTSGGWRGDITVSIDQIITPGGLTPTPSRVASMAGRGVMVRLLGHRDPRPGQFSMVTDVVLEKVIWNNDNQTIALSPQGTVERDFSTIVESFGGTVAA